MRTSASFPGRAARWRRRKDHNRIFRAGKILTAAPRRASLMPGRRRGWDAWARRRRGRERRRHGALADRLRTCLERLSGRAGAISGLSAEARAAHIAWDPGALALARGLAQRLDAALVAARISRLIYDLNRPPEAEGAMRARSELWDIPGNRDLDPAARLAPHRGGLSAVPRRTRRPGGAACWRAACTRRWSPCTASRPVWFGQPREVELGVIHDADPALALAVLAAARRRTGAARRAERALFRRRRRDPYAANCMQRPTGCRM